MTVTEPFWQTTALANMTQAQWESLCDGCGKCCLHKLEDEDTGEVCFTNVACRQLDLKTARCMKYEERKRFVPDCVVLTPASVGSFHWLPDTCAYRLVSEGRELPRWHPLVSGNPETVIAAGISVAGRVVDERAAGDFEDHLFDWSEDG